MAEKESIKQIPRKLLVFLIVISIILLTGTISFMFLLNLSFSKSFITTLETMAFLYHPEGTAKIIGVLLTLFGVILLWWTIWSIFDIISEGDLGEYLKTRSFFNKLRKMRNHYIIAGGGREGEEIASKLKARKKEYIIIEKDEKTAEKLKEKGFFVENKDVTNEEVLEEANLKQAKALILTLPEVEKNLLVTLTAKEISPETEIYARCDKPSFASKLKRAGAKKVVVPEIEAANKIIDELF